MARAFWHRMGDAGYLDAQDRFWFCGRVAHRVLTAEGPLYSIPCEAIFNNASGRLSRRPWSASARRPAAAGRSSSSAGPIAGRAARATELSCSPS